MEAEHAVDRFARELLSIYAIDRADVVIALHNNTEENYSALSYQKGGVYADDAEEVFIKHGSDPDDFFFVTERAVFDALRRRAYNVVLQDNRRATDDGSLSVYCGRAGVRYINVEAQDGHLDQQVAMLRRWRRYSKNPARPLRVEGLPQSPSSWIVLSMAPSTDSPDAPRIA